MADLPVLIKTDPPKNIPSPFGTVEEFMFVFATLGEDGVRPSHFETLGDHDEIKGRLAVSNGMNYLRHASDLQAARSYSIMVDNRPIVLYGPTPAAATFWQESIAEGKNAKQIYDGWIALRELLNSIKGDAEKSE